MKARLRSEGKTDVSRTLTGDEYLSKSLKYRRSNISITINLPFLPRFWIGIGDEDSQRKLRALARVKIRKIHLDFRLIVWLIRFPTPNYFPNAGHEINRFSNEKCRFKEAWCDWSCSFGWGGKEAVISVADPGDSEESPQLHGISEERLISLANMGKGQR